MLVPNHHANTPEYRYGFQGQEMDDELKGEGKSINYTYRMHDPRVGRFFAVDPLEAKYPYYSPYQFSGNRVIDMVELEGLEPATTGDELEGETAYATDALEEAAFASNPDPMAGGGEIPKSHLWVMHKGSESTTDGWMREKDYKGTIMPYALDIAFSRGWSIGFDWQDARNAINNPKGGSDDNFSLSTSFFLRSRVFDGTETGFYHSDGLAIRDVLEKIGASFINKENTRRYYSATGNINQMDFDSPFFMMAGSFRSIPSTSFTTSEGFLFGSIKMKTPVDLEVGFYASEYSLQLGKFRYSTMAPDFLASQKDFFSRRLLQITPDFQSSVGPWTRAMIPKGTTIQFGIVGPQKGQPFGTWLQIYAKEGVPFTP